MLTLESLNPDKNLSVYLAVKFAEKALPIWEAQCPEDKRPRAAIEAAQAWLNNPSDTTAYAAADAANAAYDAACAFGGAAWSARSAANAARAAYASALVAADNAAANAARAAYAADYAADAAVVYASQGQMIVDYYTEEMTHESL